jgi:predicted peroxiredoxin
MLVQYQVEDGLFRSGRDTLILLTKEAVRIALAGTAVGIACEGWPPLAELCKRFEAAGGRYYVCPVCFNAKHLDADALIPSAELYGTVPMWNWIGAEPAATFSY